MILETLLLLAVGMSIMSQNVSFIFRLAWVLRESSAEVPLTPAQPSVPTNRRPPPPLGCANSLGWVFDIPLGSGSGSTDKEESPGSRVPSVMKLTIHTGASAGGRGRRRHRRRLQPLITPHA